MTLIKTECLNCTARDCSILKSSNKDILNLISASKISGILKKGEILFRNGQDISGVYFVMRGLVKLEVESGNHKSLIISLAEKGNILGHRFSCFEATHRHTAVALSDVQYCYIPKKRFCEIMDIDEKLKARLLHQYLYEINQIENKALSMAFKTVRKRIAEIILMLANLHKYSINKRSFYIDLNRQDIADLAGTTKEQVSKIMNDLERENILKCNGRRFTYIDIPRLIEN